MICPIYDQCQKYLRHLTDQTIDLFMPYLGLSLFGVELVFGLCMMQPKIFINWRYKATDIFVPAFPGNMFVKVQPKNESKITKHAFICRLMLNHVYVEIQLNICTSYKNPKDLFLFWGEKLPTSESWRERRASSILCVSKNRNILIRFLLANKMWRTYKINYYDTLY